MYFELRCEVMKVKRSLQVMMRQKRSWVTFGSLVGDMAGREFAQSQFMLFIQTAASKFPVQKFLEFPAHLTLGGK